MKKSILIPVIGVITLIAIVGVGFAAWLIVSPINVNPIGGTITAENLINKEFTLAASAFNYGDGNTGIHFGMTTTPVDAEEGSWFTFDSGTKNESLTATTTLTLTPVNGKIDDDNNAGSYLVGREIKLSLKVSGANDEAVAANLTKIRAAIDDNYIAAPTIVVTKSDATIATVEGSWLESNNEIYVVIDSEYFTDVESTGESDKGSSTVTVTINFNWGSAFGGLNPYNYYNAAEEHVLIRQYNATNTAAATAALNAIYALNDIPFVFSITENV